MGRRGGVIVTATWTPEGVFGDLSKAAAPYMPPPPDYASPPPLWGREDHVRELFGGVATGVEFERHSNRIEWGSVDAFADFFMAHFPPMVTAKAMLGDRFSEMRERVVEVWRRRNKATGGRLLFTAGIPALDRAALTARFAFRVRGWHAFDFFTLR